MDYKKMKADSARSAAREKTLKALVVVLVLIIAVLTVACITLMAGSNQYRAMYEESLKTQLNMQNEINSLRSTEQELPIVSGGDIQPENADSADNGDDGR